MWIAALCVIGMIVFQGCVSGWSKDIQTENFVEKNTAKNAVKGLVDNEIEKENSYLPVLRETVYRAKLLIEEH